MPKTATPVGGPFLKRRREEDSESENELRQFRRVRIRCRQQARKQSKRDEAQRELLESGGKLIRCVCGTQDVGMRWDTSDYLLFATANQAWLIRCAVCKVWQHRSCVGAENGNEPPGGFCCERCSRVKPVDDHSNSPSSLLEDAEEYNIKCVCGSDEDNGNTIYCDRCSTWQHVRCYLPGLSPAELQPLTHFCVDCDPRPLSAVTPTGQRTRVGDEHSPGQRNVQIFLSPTLGRSMSQIEQRPRETDQSYSSSPNGSWRPTSPSPESLTCFFWASQGYCLQGERDCPYAHYDTGKVGRPLSLPHPAN